MPGWAVAVAAAAELQGTWRLRMEVRSTAEVPVLRDVATTTVTVGVLDVRPDGAGWVAALRTCAVDVQDGNPLARTVLPPALIAALPLTVVPVDVDGDRVTIDLGTSALGYDPVLAGPGLPTTPGDAGVIDVEGDGRPGATVRVEVRGVGSFGLDVVQRSRAILAGAWSGDEVRGGVRTVDFAQVVLAADHPWLRRSPVVRHDDAGSTFVLTRLPEGASCADVVGGA